MLQAPLFPKKFDPYELIFTQCFKAIGPFNIYGDFVRDRFDPLEPKCFKIDLKVKTGDIEKIFNHFDDLGMIDEVIDEGLRYYFGRFAFLSLEIRKVKYQLNLYDGQIDHCGLTCNNLLLRVVEEGVYQTQVQSANQRTGLELERYRAKMIQDIGQRRLVPINENKLYEPPTRDRLDGFLRIQMIDKILELRRRGWDLPRGGLRRMNFTTYKPYHRDDIETRMCSFYEKELSILDGIIPVCAHPVHAQCLMKSTWRNNLDAPECPRCDRVIWIDRLPKCKVEGCTNHVDINPKRGGVNREFMPTCFDHMPPATNNPDLQIPNKETIDFLEGKDQKGKEKLEEEKKALDLTKKEWKKVYEWMNDLQKQNDLKFLERNRVAMKRLNELNGETNDEKTENTVIPNCQHQKNQETNLVTGKIATLAEEQKPHFNVVLGDVLDRDAHLNEDLDDDYNMPHLDDQPPRGTEGLHYDDMTPDERQMFRDRMDDLIYQHNPAPRNYYPQGNIMARQTLGMPQFEDYTDTENMKLIDQWNQATKRKQQYQRIMKNMLLGGRGVPLLTEDDLDRYQETMKKYFPEDDLDRYQEVMKKHFPEDEGADQDENEGADGEEEFQVALPTDEEKKRIDQIKAKETVQYIKIMGDETRARYQEMVDERLHQEMVEKAEANRLDEKANPPVEVTITPVKANTITDNLIKPGDVTTKNGVTTIKPDMPMIQLPPVTVPAEPNAKRGTTRTFQMQIDPATAKTLKDVDRLAEKAINTHELARKVRQDLGVKDRLDGIPIIEVKKETEPVLNKIPLLKPIGRGAPLPKIPPLKKV